MDCIEIHPKRNLYIFHQHTAIYLQVAELQTSLSVHYTQNLKTTSHQVTGTYKCFLPGISAAGYDLKSEKTANPNKCIDLCRAQNPSGRINDKSNTIGLISKDN